MILNMFDRKSYMKKYHHDLYLKKKKSIDDKNFSYYKNHKEEIVKYKKQWYADNHERLLKMRKTKYDNTPVEQKRNTNLIRNYNITIDDFNELFELQKGCCAICGRHQSEFKKSLSVDHDHKSGKIRGLLCQKCNHGIGQFDDCSELLIIAAQYLKIYE